ncbi:hypothetical protein BDV93DRAFT_552721 [Ceratobasidium sp. AG-I]|nr:hypothetical protein BDV93DRAFT_552721 [Ceratobasidium sp. AG-I]
MASRSTRGMASLQDAIEKLSLREKLLLSQAIYECGSTKWDEVSKMVTTHPLTERPQTFSPSNCNAMYNHLMRDVGYTASNPPPGDTTAARADAHKQMAFHYYQQHVQALRDLIVAEENRFKTLTTEIEEINAGKWDDKILSDLNASSTSEGFARPSASPLPRHMTLNMDDLGQRADSPLNSPAGRSTRDATPADMGSPRTIPGSPATSRSKPVSTTSSGSRPPWNSKDNKRVREKKERRARELGLSPLVPDTQEVPDDIVPDTPIEDVPQTPVVGSSGVDLVEARSQVSTSASVSASAPASGTGNAVPADAGLAETPNIEDATPTPAGTSVTADAPGEPDEDVVESSQPKDDNKGGTAKRRASDVSMADAAQSPEPSTSNTSLVRPSVPLTSTPTPTSTAPPPTAPPAHTGTNKRFQNVITMVHQQIYQHRGGNIFHNPIKKSEAPDYYEIVRRPMDLKTVKSRIKDGVISSADHFKRDVFLMFANAIMYNRPGTSVNDIAAEMMIESERHIADFRAAEEFNKPTRG